jgi:hypothetical protein
MTGIRGRGFDDVTLTDCVAATSQEEHDNAIAYDYPMSSRLMSSKEFLDELGGAAEDTSRGTP